MWRDKLVPVVTAARSCISALLQAKLAAPKTKLELVQLAEDSVQDLEYLRQLSENMLPAVDMACTAEGQVFPLHSYVLMAASPLFSGLVAEHFSDVLKGSCKTEV